MSSPEAPLLTYPATITLSTSTLTFLTRQLRAHRVTIGSPWRKLPAHRQALLVLAHEVDHLHGTLYTNRMRPGVEPIPVSQYRGTGQS